MTGDGLIQAYRVFIQDQIIEYNLFPLRLYLSAALVCTHELSLSASPAHPHEQAFMEDL